LIRPRRDVPLDILGGGYVVAPPSRVERGQYQFLEGSLDDLANLPKLLDAPPAIPPDCPPDWGSMRDGDGRNAALFRQIGRAAHQCDDFDQLLDYARTQNEQFGEPMTEAEVLKSANSIWKYTIEGRNWFGRHSSRLDVNEVDALVTAPYSLLN